MRTKKKKRRQTKHKQSSTARNVALLFLSLGLLTGASMLFSYFGNRSDLSLDPVQKAWNGMVSDEQKGEAPADESETKSSSVSGFDYTFYDILSEKEGQDQGQEHFSVQVGAFKNREQAQELAGMLQEKSRVTFRIDKEGKLSCVRWGTFTNRDVAEKQCEKLSAKLQRSCIVVKM